VLVNALIVLAGTLVFNVMMGTLRALPAVAGAPWHDYLGGVCGFAIIAIMAYAFPRMGGALALALMVLGQSAMALTIDHYGLWGKRTVPGDAHAPPRRRPPRRRRGPAADADFSTGVRRGPARPVHG
jgi:uncharacterized membrane protein YdcZ (DUF606 family)